MCGEIERVETELETTTATLSPSQDDREAASFRVMMAALLVAVVGIAFAIGIACTDRPAQPKNSTE